MARMLNQETGKVQFVDQTTSPTPQGSHNRCCEVTPVRLCSQISPFPVVPSTTHVRDHRHPPVTPPHVLVTLPRSVHKQCIQIFTIMYRQK